MTAAQAQVEHYKQSIIKALNDDTKPWSKYLDLVESKTNIPRFYLFMGGAAFCALYLIFGYGAQLLCNIIGVAYPAYMSIHAIETSPKEDDTKWLTYWVTFGIMAVIEYFSGVLMSLIPFYWLLKCLFLIWCMLPIEQNGSKVIYMRVVRPYFLKHHAYTDKLIDDVVNKAKGTVDFLKKD